MRRQGVFFFLVIILISKNGIVASPQEGLTRFLEIRLLRETKELLKNMDSAREEAALLGSVPLEVAEIANDQVAVYVSGVKKIIFNRGHLSQLYWDIAGRSEPVEDPLHVMAAHLLPLVAHELRHAFNDERFGHLPATQEEELSASITRVAVFHEARQEFEDEHRYSTVLAQQDLIWWISWRDDYLEGVRRRVEEAYFKLPSIASDQTIEDAQEVELVQGWQKKEQTRNTVMRYCRENLEPFEACLKRYGVDKNYGQWIKKKSGGLVENQRQFQETTEYFAEMEDFWSDPQRVKEVRLYYLMEECRAWRLWQKHFPQEDVKWDNPGHCDAR